MRLKQWMTCAVGCGALLGTGCTGPMVDGTIFQPQPRRDPELARIAVDNQQMSVEFRRLSEQLTVLNRNQELLEAQTRARVVAEENARLAALAYENGAGSLIQVIDAQRQSQRAQLASIEAEALLRADMAALYVATASDWRGD